MSEWFKVHAWNACMDYVHRGFESRSLRIIYMYLIKNILFLITFLIKISEDIDTLIVTNYEVDSEAILIPDYVNGELDFEIEFLNKKRKFFLYTNIGYLIEQNSTMINVSPIFNYKNFKFKMNIDYLFDSNPINYNNNWKNTYDFLERIEYLKLFLFENRLNISFGEIENLSFGPGYLVSNYNNSFKSPNIRNIGLELNYRNSNNSVTHDFFISSLRDLSNNGGLMGNRITILYSKSFPLRLGLGHIIDFNQLSLYDDNMPDVKRKISAFELDLNFPLLNNFDEKIFLFGELSAIDFPEKRYYKRVDDSEFTNDKKSRNGIWGIAFPGIKYINSFIEFDITLNYNSAIYAPFYFNSTYDFEKIRYREYNILENEILYQDEAELLSLFSSSDSTLFIPKDMYGMINESENTYPTYGFSSAFKFKFNKDNQIHLSYSYFKNISEIDDSFYNSVALNYEMNKKLIFFPTKLEIYLSKNFFKIKESYQNNENLIYGLNLNMLLYKSISLEGEIKHTFYDINFDGKIDLVPYVNIGLNYKY